MAGTLLFCRPTLLCAIPEGGNVYKTLALLQKIKINKAKCMIVGKCIYILYA